MSTKLQIESLLFMAGRPLSAKKMSEILSVPVKEIEKEANELVDDYTNSAHGIHIMASGSNYQMATSPDNARLIGEFIKSEQTGDLSKPSLETLTIIAYRGPIAKSEIEQIRGVNCSLILRNLLIRGLVEAQFDRTLKTTAYQVTLAFLEFLGVRKASDLPDFERLHSDERLKALFEMQEKQSQQQDSTPETLP